MNNTYFYHPDHLGSTSLVTNSYGEISQNISYIPYGEIFVEETAGGWQSPYYFNAKEFDEETGLYYYGARYLDPAGARWLSADPMWEDAQGVTPYHYCHGNPVKLVDIDGLFDEFSPTAKDFDDAIDWIYDLPNQITKWVQSIFGEETAPKGGEHGYGNGRSGKDGVGPKSKSAAGDRDNSNYERPIGSPVEKGKGTPTGKSESTEETIPEGMRRVPVYVEGDPFVRKDGGKETPIIRKYDTLVTKKEAESIYEETGEYVIRIRKK